MRAYLIIIFQVRQQHMSEVPLSEHNNVVKAFPSDRTDQPFGTSILPRGAWRRWSVANAHRSKSSDEDIATRCNKRWPTHQISDADQVANAVSQSGHIAS